MKLFIVDAYSEANSQNALWKYFGVKQSGRFRPEDTNTDDKLDFIIKTLDAMNTPYETISEPIDFDKLPPPPDAFPDDWEDIGEF